MIGSFLAGLKAEALRLLRVWRNGPRARSISLTTALIFLAVGLLDIAGAGFAVDTTAVLAVRHLGSTAWYIAEKITHLGASGYIFAISAAVMLAAAGFAAADDGKRRAPLLRLLAGRALLAFAAAATSGIASQVVKHLVGRARPKFLDTLGPFHFDLLSLKASLASFPSGHTVTAFAMACVLGLFAPRWRIPLYALAALIGLSRVLIGAHYPSDVLAGAALGWVCAILTCRAFASRRIALEENAGQIRARGPACLIRALREWPGHGKASAP